jgi:hypothetical protein
MHFMQGADSVHDIGELCCLINACTQCIGGVTTLRTASPVTVDMAGRNRLPMRTSNCTAQQQQAWSRAEVWLQQAEEVTAESVRAGLFSVSSMRDRCAPSHLFCVCTCGHSAE